ncbi:MAG TPA: carboxypeptidase-like regulatory domain-containing protein, partial [Flavobacterium sp.]|nr:carboxypeptidase-like regulatory domain-containing protein [Flavobacterium sp.]
MKKNIVFLLFFLFATTSLLFAQTKVKGVVVDKSNKPVRFANIAFKNSSEGVVSNEDGIFYLESPKTYQAIVITSVGFDDKEIILEKST